MTDYTELKRLVAQGSLPPIVATLIAENEQLGRYLCTCRDCGGEGSLHTGDWHSYSHMEPPEPVMEKCGECDGTGLLGEIQDLYQVITERDQLKAENEALQAVTSLSKLLPELDDALEDLEIHGRHDDQGYRKLKDWYRKVALACTAVDISMGKEAGHD